jgi:hypothetical protein
VKIIWIPITYCLYDETEIGEYQAVYNPKQPLDTLNPADLNKALVKICKEIKTAATESSQNP